MAAVPAMPKKSKEEIDQVIKNGSFDQYAELYPTLSSELRDYMWAKSSLEQQCQLYLRSLTHPDPSFISEKHGRDYRNKTRDIARAALKDYESADGDYTLFSETTMYWYTVRH